MIRVDGGGLAKQEASEVACAPQDDVAESADGEVVAAEIQGAEIQDPAVGEDRPDGAEQAGGNAQRGAARICAG